MPLRRLFLGLMLVWAPSLWSQQFSTKVNTSQGEDRQTYQLPAGLLAANGKAWTIEVQLTPHPATGPFLTVADAGGHVRIKGEVVAESVEFEVITDFRPQPLALLLPLRSIDAAKLHNVLLRYQGFRLAFFCDGVLVDEDWPIGTVMAGEIAQASLNAPAARLAIWNTALPDAEIVSQNGGPAFVNARADALFGPQWRKVQYGRPRGFNTNAGDAMPFFHNGTFHLFFLLDRRQHHSKWGLGAHQWGHISSTDLVHWTQYPPALTIDHEWEASICTGSVFFHNGRYYAFYATRMPDRSEHLAMAESDDAIHFRKLQPNPFTDPTAPYLYGPNRDPFVFQQGDKFHMLVTAAIADKGSAEGHGALEHLTSHDLKTWTVAEKPFLIPDYPDQPECSDLFKWRDWYYLTFGIGGVTHYRIAKTPTGPWLKPRVDVLDGTEARVMKSAPFTRDRRLLVGFVPHDKHWGGDLVFRELVQESDGSLGTKFPPEMSPHGIPVNVDSHIQLDATHPTEAMKEMGGQMHLTAVFGSSQGSTPFGVKVVSGEGGSMGEELLIDPRSQRVAWTDSNGAATQATLDHVDGLDRPIQLNMILDGTVVDVSINDRRTLIHRLDAISHPHLEFFTQGSDLNVSKIAVSSIP